jgi:hypothetical protein
MNLRQRLSAVLATDDTDDDTGALVRPFWSRAKTLPPRTGREATVVDMAHWAVRRDIGRR